MEQSPYVDATLELYRRAATAYRQRRHLPAGLSLPHRKRFGRADPDGRGDSPREGRLQRAGGNCLPVKKDVDENYFHLAQRLLSPEARAARVRAAIATHDRALIANITEWAAAQGVPKTELEFQMLYGIQRAEQLRLAQRAIAPRVLIAYGSFWYPWFMRRLAERPANVLFLARNFFSN